MDQALDQRSYSRFSLIEAAVYLLLLPASLLARPIFLPLFLMIPILWGIRVWRTGRPWPKSPINLPLFLLVAMTGVSLLVTSEPSESLEKVVGLLFGICLFWMCTAFFHQSWTAILYGFLAFWLLVSGIVGVSLIKTAWVVKFPTLAPLVALFGRLEPIGALIPLPSINANQLAGVLMWLVPLAITALIGIWTADSESIWAKNLTPNVSRFAAWGLLLLFGIIFLALILTQSRTGWFGIIVALWGMGLFVGPRIRQALFGLAAVGLVFSLMIWANPVWRNTALEQIGLGEADAQPASDGEFGIETRIEIWSRAIYGIQDFPMTGMGLNSFRSVVDPLYPLFLIPAEVDIAHAHNHFLQVGLDLGIPGLIAYLAIWMTAIWVIWESWSASTDRFSRALVIGFAGGLVAYWIYGIADTVALGAKPGFLWWIYLALIFSWHHHLVNGSPE